MTGDVRAARNSVSIMEQHQPSISEGLTAARWLETNASILFAAVRRVVPDSLCAYDLALELSAMLGHRWPTFEPSRDGTRLAWALRLATELIADATARGLVPKSERHRGGAPAQTTLSAADLHRLSELAHASLHLDEDAGHALAAMERGAPSPGALARLVPSDLVRRSPSDVRQDG